MYNTVVGINMRFGIYTNLTRDENGKSTIKLANLFREKGLDFAMSNDLISLNYDCKYLSNKDLAMESDIIMVFGGDGTILRIVKDCAKYETLIFAINMGHIGFLTEIENINLEDSLDLICNKEYNIDERDLLDVSYRGKHHYALNEIVVARGSRTKMVTIELSINDCIVDKINADGIIISTPTGSTAYSLSAGGPICAPDVDAFIVTPISPHSLHSRPIVINNKCNISIKLNKADPCAYLNLDGYDLAEMVVDDDLKISKATLSAKFIRFNNYNFYDNFLNKLRSSK